MSGTLSFAAALGVLRQQADAAAASVGRARTVVDSMPPPDKIDRVREAADDAATAINRMQGFYAKGATKVTAATAGDGSDTGAYRGTSPDGEPKSILDQVGQQDLISMLRGSPVERYLESFVALYVEKLEKGFSITPQQSQMIEQALHAPQIGAEWIIKNLGGGVGRAFNFAQLEHDIKEILRAQQDAARRAKGKTSARVSRPGTTTQSQGSASSSLTLLLNAGALR